MVQFTKPAKTLDEQITLLQERGLIIREPDRAKRYLEVISFFRLSSYMRPFQVPHDQAHTFKADAEFKSVVELYAFDRELRLLIMDAIERMEVAVRATLNNHMGTKYQTEQPHSGSHWYLNESLFRRDYNHKRMLSEVESCQSKAQQELKRDIQKINKSNASQAVKEAHIQNRVRESYPRFYQHSYNEPRLMPSWAMVEELTFGSISHLYQGLAKDADRKGIAKRFDVPQDVFQSWLHTLNFVRNCCAHHSRLWNRELSISPKVPHGELWQLPVRLEPSMVQPNRRIYVVLLILAHLMRQISPDSQWHNKVKAMVTVIYPNVPLAPMGFPDDWRTHIFWGGEDE
ncbi:Abi family protein [Photobacterium sp. WH77]|uniref:Abi family protein n=1 Tax=unclassified Photobacterium TaxID=2628852 RepID=UPI001EDB27D6|nr:MULTISPECIES: Abi family protein [unclassified Photobacterium]MCG2835570.1 Abi family protein [Photobacterium sp. WH77]MCG2843183.1 Abi family protein [Photobacterium sp. WH80]